jgi:diguanylate cyclase (GGDEF)-like protein
LPDGFSQRECKHKVLLFSTKLKRTKNLILQENKKHNKKHYPFKKIKIFIFPKIVIHKSKKIVYNNYVMNITQGMLMNNNTKTVLVKPTILFLYFVIIISIFVIFTYNFFIPKYKTLETNQNNNNNNINTTISKINTSVDNIRKITNDYSKWDDSYNFIKDRNKDYINENFREGTSTLEDLDIDLIIYANKQKKVLFSKYQNDLFKNYEKDFELNLINTFHDITKINTFFKYNSKKFIIIKSDILKSDFSGTVSGHIYTGKLITNDILNKKIQVFKKLHIEDTSLENEKKMSEYKYLKNIKIKTKYKDSEIKNYIEIYDNKNNFIFSIVGTNPRTLVNEGTNTIMFFNIIVSLFISIIFFILYRYQLFIQKYNFILENKVDRRTNQLSKSLRTLKRKNKQLHNIAHTDELTKINNRRNYFLQSEKELKKSIINNTEFTVVIMDIDHFKKVNDTYGHAIGDKVLIEFSKLVNRILKENTIFGRVGGEEFCITFMDTPLKDCIIIAEEIRTNCETTALDIDNESIRFTVSLGLTSRNNITDIDEILLEADKALYEAKNNGRNQLVVSQDNIFHNNFI